MTKPSRKSLQHSGAHKLGHEIIGGHRMHFDKREAVRAGRR
jgi:hypothetical protein